MKHAVAASSFLALAAASPQFGGGNQGPNGNHGGPNGGGYAGNAGGDWSSAPSCVSSCWQDLRNSNTDANDWSSFCTGDQLNTLNDCIANSDCDQTDKDATYQVIAQACANAGQSVSASPEATFSATSGKPSVPFSAGPWGRFGNGNGKGDWTTNSDWQSWTSAHPTPTVTDSAAWNSWASSAKSDWSSWASVNGVPAASRGGFPFGGPGP